MDPQPEHTSKTFSLGEVIVAAGDLGETMFVVLSGRAGIGTAGGLPPVSFGVGEFFGEMSLIDSERRSATIVALEDDTKILEIDRARFLYLVSQQPSFALAIMRTLSRRMRGKPFEHNAPLQSPAAAFVAKEVKPNLWQFRSNGRSCNSYLVVGRERRVLIDPGLASFYPALESSLAEVGHPVEGIDTVLLTHEHADHVGAAALVPGSPMIAAHTLAANKVLLQDDFATVSGVIGERVCQTKIDWRLAEGSVIDVAPYCFEIVHTPGHTSGCVCLADRDNDILISGDTIMAGGALGGIFGSGNISDYIYSLRRLQSWRLSTTLPGHGRISTTGKDDIVAALTRCNALLKDTRALFEAIGDNDGFDRILTSLKALNT